MSPLQPQRPIVVVAYGLTGADWLDRLRAEVLPQPSDVSGDSGLFPLQFWAMGLDPEEFSEDRHGLICMGSDPNENQLRQRLDTIRTHKLTQQFPGLEVNSILVLERWSPFETDVSLRTSLHKRCDIGCRVHFQEGAEREFQFTWVGLADAVRPAGRLEEEDNRRLQAHFSLPSLPSFHFLVDRQNQEGAVIDAGEADDMLRVLARSLILSELSGTLVVDRLTDADTDDADNPGTVVPFAVSHFQHGSQELGKAAEARFRSRLLSTPGDPQVWQVSGSLVEEIHRDLSHGNALSAEVAKRRALETISKSLARGMARKRGGDPQPWKEFEEARQELRRRLGKDPGSRVPFERGTGDIPRQRFLLQRFWQWIKTHLFRQTQDPAIPGVVTPVQKATPRNSAAEAWEEMLARAKKASSAWERWLLETTDAEGANIPWAMKDGNRVLQAWPDADLPKEPVPHTHWLELARWLVEEADGIDELGPALVELALGPAARSVEFGPSEGVKASVIEGALRDAIASFQDEHQPLSAFIGQSLSPSRVLWFHGLSEERGGLFAEFEDRGQTGAPDVIALDRMEDTVRTCLAAPMPWTRIISLYVGKTEAQE